MPTESEDRAMQELTNDDIRALAKAANLNIDDPELTDVNYSLNAMLEAMDAIDVPGVNAVEPLAVITSNTEASQ
jgi:Asp-tRNA(Asn)/Glu-tRNA(Gln) amidotransferase C subunit|tara:strand:- start:1386 stop:1607 length:222 start_codon:yes stop_codon:yes gene_type:complete